MVQHVNQLRRCVRICELMNEYVGIRRGGEEGGTGGVGGHRLREKYMLLLLLKCCFTSTVTIGLLGTGAQNGHLD